jgi:hypothetical protein
MRLANKALIMVALMVLSLSVIVSGQTLRLEGDPRNQAPTVGTGGPTGGPTGLFTVYDQDTLRRGEFTFSVAYSVFHRDPGDVHITETPISFQVGLNDYLEFFFNTDGYRGIKVDNPQNLSSFYLPNVQLPLNPTNSQFQVGAPLTVPPAIVAAPINSRGIRGGVFRPAGNQPLIAFPFVGSTVSNPSTGYTGTLGAQRAANSGGRFGGPADVFPGIGSPFGSILPGIVFSTVFRQAALDPRTCNTATGGPGCVQVPVGFTVAPSYLNDAPFISYRYGETAFNTFTVGAKIRLTRPESPFGFGLIPFYRFYYNKPDSASSFDQLQRGGSPGARTGDFGLIAFFGGRLARSVNVSANIGFVLNTNPRSKAFGSVGEVTLLDRPNEVQAAVGFDFPINRYFQPIVEVRGQYFVGGRTPNALENKPVDILGGVRIFPRRWLGFSAAYRAHLNYQRNIDNAPVGFVNSHDPSGFLGQFFIGHRNARQPDVLPNNPPVINSFTADRNSVQACPGGNLTVNLTTSATDPDGDTLLYNYTTTAGRIVGNGTTATLDLSGVPAGTTVTTTVEVDDGCGCTATRSTEIRVVDCPTPTPTPTPACPTISLDCPTGTVNPGDKITLTANLSGTAPAGVTYSWTVSAGTITAGQNTNSITVDTTGTAGQTITATVTVGGLDASCTNSASCSVSVKAPPPNSRKVDEYGNLRFNDEKARLDQFAIQLQNDPTAQGYIIVYGGRVGRAGEAQARADRAKAYLVNNRGISADRIVTVDGGYREQLTTELYVVPQGATPPQATPTVQPGEVRTTPRRVPRSRRRGDDEDDE